MSSTDVSSSSIREDIEHVISKDRSGSVGEESLLVLWRNTGVFLEFEYTKADGFEIRTSSLRQGTPKSPGFKNSASQSY